MESKKQSTRTKRTRPDLSNGRRIKARHRRNDQEKQHRCSALMDSGRNFIAKFIGEIVRTVLGL